MLGSSEAPLLAAYPQLAAPQVVVQPIVEQPSIGAQDQTDNDPTSQHAADKETDKDSSGLVRKLLQLLNFHCWAFLIPSR